jgi:predicted RNase H-like nuclease (RuvC/YqgF family)
MYKLTTDRQLSKIENIRSNCTLYRKLLLDRRLEKDKAIRILKVELDDAKENIRILENRLKQYRDVSS